MNRVMKVLFFGLIVKPVVLIVLGINLRNREKLPMSGPAIIVANHNSHLDTLVLMSLYPLSMIHKVRPVAAADYFLGGGGFLAWLSLACIGIIAMDRSGQSARGSLFEGCHQALDNDDILILFPEGSRGKPEEMSTLKKGVYFIIKDRPNTSVTPVMMHGLGRSLPKGEVLLVPFNCDVVVGDRVSVTDNSSSYVATISEQFEQLSEHCLTKNENAQ